MQKEKWVPIRGYEGSYEVSNYGNVRSLSRVVEYKHGGKGRFWPSKIIKQWMPKNGYLTVTLKLENKGSNFMVHRLVGIHFIDNPNNGWQINHKDNNKLNNKVVNLEWVTQSENMAHAFKSGAHSGKGATHYKAKKITDGMNTFGCLQEAADYYNITRKVVWDMISERTGNKYNFTYL